MEATEPTEKGTCRWSAVQTDTLVNCWRECFVELESHRNAEAWRRILSADNKKGSSKTLEQAKKKLQNLKDRYEEAKEKNKKSGEARNLPKYFDIFDDVLGTRSLVRLDEVRETQPFHQEEPELDEAVGPIAPHGFEGQAGRDELGEAVPEKDKAQPKRTKKKRATKSAATNQIVDFLAETQRQQQESMKLFIEGIQKIEENSRKHTENTLVKIAQVFAEGKRRKKRSRGNLEESSEDSERIAGYKHYDLCFSKYCKTTEENKRW